MSSYLFASGGSGGHLAPAIALAERMGSEKCVVATTQKRVDERLSEKYELLKFLSVTGFALSGGGLKVLKTALVAIIRLPGLLRRIKKGRFDTVMVLGGFGSFPVIVGARLLGLDVFGHDSNAVLGKVNKYCAPLYRKLFVTSLYRATTHRTFCKTGMPLRKELSRIPKNQAKDAFGLSNNKKSIVILGGSQGAAFLNNLAINLAPLFPPDEIEVLCVSGPGKLPEDSAASENLRFVEFVDNMAALYSSADIMIARSGAGTLAEIVQIGVPCVLVPLPNSADNHQWFNARYFLERAAGVVWEQHEPFENLLSHIASFVEHEERSNQQRVSQSHLRSELLDISHLLKTLTMPEETAV